MASNLKITVNGKEWPVASSPDTPLLSSDGTSYACTGPASAADWRSAILLSPCRRQKSTCVAPVGTVADRAITILGGLPACARKNGLAFRRCIRCSRRSSTSRLRTAATATTA